MVKYKKFIKMTFHKSIVVLKIMKAQIHQLKIKAYIKNLFNRISQNNKLKKAKT